MKVPSPDRSLVLATIVLALNLRLASAEPNAVMEQPPPTSPRLQRIVDTAVASAVDAPRNRRLSPDQIAVTLVDLTDPAHAARASHRGNVAIYPASVIKLFYLVAAHRWLEDGRLADTEELRRALRDMIVLSYNEATHYVVDLLTGTTSGPELPPDELRSWFDRRNAVNRYFAGLGYTNINANKKPWGEGPYGRETQAIKAFDPKRNALTTDATARLLVDIVTGRAVSPSRSAQMLELMKRDLANLADPEDQVRMTGPALPAGARLWSKAGWTSETRHDAVYVELPTGHRFVLVTFTVDHANEADILHGVARQVVAGLTAAGPVLPVSR
jgi:beta-lactamase class A